MSEQSVFDFRSDTVTKPDEAMRNAMAAAAVGDDVYGEDETVISLEQRVAEMLGKSAGLFVSSGTQSNLIAMLCHAGRGEEFLSGQTYHSIHYEAGGASVLGGLVACPLPVDEAGRILPEDIERAIKPDDFHFPVTRLLCLENTVNGRIQPASHLSELCALARSHNLLCHLDGARLMNAAVASNADARTFTQGFDSVSLCLSKGLGTPVGSVLVGTQEFIKKARRLRKMLGGGMRQVGILAAAGHHALDHNIERLADDHMRAHRLASHLSEIDDVHIDMNAVETNMVHMHLPETKKSGIKSYLERHGLIISPARQGFRLVIHKDISDQAIDMMVKTVASYLNKS